MSKEPGMIPLVVFLVITLALIAIVAMTGIGIYNNLVQSRVACDTAWSNIDVQLKRRHDLIPNLVEKGIRGPRKEHVR
jgi:LemA protein